ncbi:hypothetical protein CFE70_010562 [Pyrenophora teres f. teres 0-1]
MPIMAHMTNLTLMCLPEQYLTGKFVNGYGPTENTTFSTTFLVSKNEQYTNGVPIGRALSNSGAYLVVTGDGLARGYTDPARNVDRFVSVEIGGKTVRAYRTGDYVRHRPTDGQLEFFGRMDGQVKIRGNRVELGEIEHALRSDKSVREAVTVLQQPDGSEARLAGFVTLHECTAMAEEKADHTDGAPHADARKQRFLQNTQRRLVEMLEAQLPTYMVPQTLAILDAMPVNQNGKVDRKALEQQIDTQKGQSGLKRQPETETQRTMQQLWAGVLAIDADSVGLDDSFFRLGGDSIAAMKLVGEARRAGIHLTVADLFRNPKLDQLTAAAIASAHASPASIPQVEHAGPVAQSFAQGRLWFLEELHPGLTSYLMPLAVRIRGPLDLVALHSALLAVERRHETLRTTFATVDGASVQVVQPFQAKDLNIIDIVPGDEQGLTEAVHQDHSTPFDLRTEPGWRVTVYRMSNDDHVLSTVMHHIISDGWSADVLMRELAAFYSASMRGQDPLSQVQPLSVQYRDFSVWQREQAQADEHQKQLSYWVEQLQSSRPAELLCDKPRPAALSGEAGVQSIEIAGPLYAKLQSFCQLHGVTQFVVLLAAFRATHFRLTGQEDATIGTPNANRDRWEVKDMVGFFVNLQCLRIKIGDESFEELVQQVHEVANDRDLSRHPLVQLVFAVHAQRDLGQLKLEGVETENLGDTVTSRFDLEFHFSQQADGLWGSVMFSTDLYAPETIDNMLSVFRRVLETCLEQPQAAVASMPLLRDADYAKLDAMGLVRVEKTAYPRDSSVVDLFREQAAACPSRVAVKDSVAEMTYAQLDAASDVLARWLARRSLAPETLVGVFASRSCEAIVAFLGILKANLAYLPFDVKTPATRMEDILSSRPGHRLILVGAGAQLPSTKLSNIEFVSITEALDEQSAEEPGLQMPTTPHGPSATSLAYVMFTSGSTGQPKGVMVEHRGIVRLVRDNNLVQHLPSSPVMAHMANLAFDASTWEIYGTLLCGGTLVCIDAAMVLDAEAVLQTFRKHCIRTAYMAPSLFRSYILQAPALFTGLDMLCVGGEAVHLADLRAAEQYLTGKFVNGYGPTENTTFSTTFLVSKNEQYTNGVPIGRALSNSGAYVMDSGLRLVPLGVVGELVVTGDGLARGYTDPARNVDRFVSVEIGGKTVRAYRTGDYVRHRPTDGQLEFFGRMDGQVKIRGNRVELGEIEHALRSDKSVREAVTVLQQPDGSEARLAGFVTLHECTAMAEEKADHTDGAPHADARKQRFLQNTQRRLVEMLEAQLPTYMVPQTLAILDAMPVNQNGKVDRKALEQQIDTQKGQSGLKRQPETETQRTMQQLWAGVLAIDADSVGLDDSFFRLGGDSIAAMKLVGEARRAGIHLTVADLFRNPKLEAVASLNLSLGNSSPENIVAFALLGETSDVTQIREEVAASCNTNTSLIEDIYPCSPLQEGMMALTSKRPGDYIMQSVLALHDDTDEDRFRAAWERVVQSTAVLRTRIVHSSKMGMLQVVLADGIEWEQANELEQYLEKDKSVSMGLGDSLARYALVRDVGTGKRWMVWTLHHALYDGWSLPQIANLVTEVYHGAEVGKQPGFNTFIKYLGEQDHEAAAAYWQGTLADCQAISFPALPLAVQQPVADATTAFQCPALARRPSDITMSTLIRAAWALLASSYTSSDDVVFGATVTGRNAPVAGIEAMAGPTIATVPVRVRVQHSHKVSEFLHSVQQQATEMIPYEQTGLHETAKVSADARHACSFQTLLIVQSGSNGDIAHDALGEWRSHSDLQDFTTYALMVQCVLADDEVQIIASFDRRAIEPWQVDKMLRQFSFVMQQLATADAEAGIASIDTLTPEDRQQLWEWNHDAKARPDAPAICAWDGDMTYGELDVLSGRLAGHLVELGVGPEDIVPLCFEKSMWTVVAMLAVLKAGGAFLLLDPSLPHERLRLMCRKVSAKLSLASEASAPLAKDLVGTVVIVNADSALQLAHHASPITSVRPHTQLGAVGEVLVEGPVLGREYIDEPDKTASTFIEAPAWRASLGLSAGQQRLYKTGDLARYKDDGSIELIGRKDNQVKLRGQRIEVEEIEHQARLAEADVAEIAVELIQPKDGEDGMLACFIVVEDSASNEDELSGKRTRLDTRTQRTIGKIQDRLERFLPQYMVPAVFIPILTLPVTWSKKIDRKRLREVGSTFSGRELAELQATTQGLKRQPSTENEKALQQLWAGVLAIDADSIGLDDSFFRLGGDSIAAMKLVGEARRAGIHLTVADLFRNPKLECLSRIGRKLLHRIVEPVLHFSLLPPAIKEDILSNQKSLGKINDLASIVDILPVTHCQKFFLSRGQLDPRIAFNYFYVDMGPQLDLYLLRNSCRKVLDHLSILRSRFVPLDDQWFQIILHDLDLPFSVHDVNESLDEASHAICMQDIERTDPLEVPTSFKVVRYKSTHNRLIIRLSHAQYDGVSFPIILRTLISTYQQEPLHPVAEFSTFLAHARKIQTLSGRYWRELLQGSRPIRVTEKLRLQVQEDISPHLVSVEKYMDAPRLPEGITMASLISSAWALVLAHITGEQDIVFGHLVAGRNSDIPEVAEIVGPCLNVIPVRTLVYPIKTSKDLIQSVQDQHVSLGESDSMGWDEIVKDCTDWPAGTMYDSLVQHQNIIARPEISFAGVTAKLNWFQNPFGEAPFLFLFSEPEDSQLKIMISGNTHFLTVERASLLVDMLAQTAQALSYSPQASLASHRLSLPGCAFNDG